MKKFMLLLALSVVGLMAADGATLYKRCAVCHGAAGDKIPPGSKAKTTINILDKDTIVSNLKGYKAKTLNQFSAGPIMYGQAATLSDADMQALADYIVTLKK